MQQKKIPKHFHTEPEAMYMELQQLKKVMSDQKAENIKLRTTLERIDKEKQKKEKQVEELLKGQARGPNQAKRGIVDNFLPFVL